MSKMNNLFHLDKEVSLGVPMGINIWDAVGSAIQYAKEYDCKVKLAFNDRVIELDKDSRVKDKVDSFFSEGTKEDKGCIHFNDEVVVELTEAGANYLNNYFMSWNDDFPYRKGEPYQGTLFQVVLLFKDLINLGDEIPFTMIKKATKP